MHLRSNPSDGLAKKGKSFFSEKYKKVMSVREPLLAPPTPRLTGLLEDAEIRDAWRNFLKESYCSENMLFYEAVEEYRTSSLSARVKLAQTICSTYISEQGDHQVNLTSKERKEIVERVQRLKEASEALPTLPPSTNGQRRRGRGTNSFCLERSGLTGPCGPF